MHDTVPRLEPSLSTLEALRVTEYRNQDWCKNIGYSGGIFTDNNESSTCNLFGPDVEDEDIPAFTPEASQAFEEVASALSEKGVSVRIISAHFDEEGALIAAAFTIEAGQRDGWVYAYQPGYEPLPEDIPTQTRYTPINADWYFIWDEWM